MSAYSDFKTTVLSFVNRSSTIFTSGALDYVLIAMNSARREAQRKYSFNLNKRTAFAQLSIGPASMLTDFDADPTGAGALVVVREVERCWEYNSATVGATTRYYRTARVPYWGHQAFNREVGLSSSTFGSATQVVGSLQASTQFAYRQGTDVFHSTLTTATWYMFDVVAWIADHDGGSGSDIFFTYFYDWLLYATLMELNQFLKDGERFNFDDAFMNRKWESVKQYDAQQAATEMINLD